MSFRKSSLLGLRKSSPETPERQGSFRGIKKYQTIFRNIRNGSTMILPGSWDRHMGQNCAWNPLETLPDAKTAMKKLKIPNSVENLENHRFSTFPLFPGVGGAIATPHSLSTPSVEVYCIPLGETLTTTWQQGADASQNKVWCLNQRLQEGNLSPPTLIRLRGGGIICLAKKSLKIITREELEGICL